MQTVRPALEPRPPRRLRLLAAGVVALSLAALLGTWSWGRLHSGVPRDTGPEVAADRAEAIVRRTQVAVADADAVWRRLAGEVGERYAPGELRFFTRTTETPCAGGAMVSGPFYCPDTRTLAFDLAFLQALGERLGRQRELGLALVSARLSAEHLQRELGVLDAAALRLIGANRGGRAAVGEALALQADCLTGLWAAAAGTRIGPLPDGFWSQLVWSARNVAEELAARGTRVPPELNPFAAGAQEARQQAFAQGYAGRGLAACPAPAAVAAAE